MFHIEKYLYESNIMGINLTNIEFIERAKNIHENKYDYSIVNYIDNSTKIKIICPEHGIFEQKPKDHLNGQGCPKCAKKYKPTSDEFIQNVNKIHNNKYDYSLVNYVGNKIKIDIICPKHGIFSQTPHNHIYGQGCPKCKQPKGEIKINQFLIKNNLNYEYQKKFDGCINERSLYFDFYLPDYNTLIEYDGKQHFKTVKYFGGEKGLKIRQERDKIKKEFCNKNDINLIRIKYDEDIENKLKALI
jgi:Zn finger protein HypA/HybF involved in hydrogenase expression